MSMKTRPVGLCCRPIDPIPLPATQQRRIVEIFKALADPTRLDILRLVAAQDAPICACDVGARFHVSQPTISHHMKVLRDAGLITATRRGVWAYYAADTRGLAILRDSIETLAPSSLAATG